MLPDFDPAQEEQLAQFLRPHGKEGEHIAFAHLPAIFAPLQRKVQQLNPVIVIIAGTNGKGETAYRLQNLLQQAGISTALWMSPHIFTLRERITFNGQMLSYAEWQDLLEQTSQAVATAPLSYYEFLFYAFLQSFLQRPAQVMLLEVGLGGRWDAVNLLDADLSVLTSIGRDHQALLGKTYRAILTEKLGVTRPQQILLSALELKYCQQITQAWANQYQLRWQDLFVSRKLRAADDYSQRNAALAAQAASIVQTLVGQRTIAAPGLPAGPHRSCRSWAQGPGRREFWPKKITGPWISADVRPPRWLFIGGHNPDGIRKMIAYLQQNQIHIDQVLASFSQRPWDDLKLNLRLLGTINGRPPITLAAFAHPKAVALADLQNLARDVCLAVPVKVKCWHQKLQEEFAHEAGTTLVTGSFYFVGLVQHTCWAGASGLRRSGGVCHR